MSSWKYGLVVEEGKVILCECFFDKDHKFTSYAYVGSNEIKTKNDRMSIAADINAQILENEIFNSKNLEKTL